MYEQGMLSQLDKARLRPYVTVKILSGFASGVRMHYDPGTLVVLQMKLLINSSLANRPRAGLLVIDCLP
jgi:hypothetical protein